MTPGAAGLWSEDLSSLEVTHPHHMPSPESLKRNKVKFASPPHYFLTFQGTRNVGNEGGDACAPRLGLRSPCQVHPLCG